MIKIRSRDTVGQWRVQHPNLAQNPLEPSFSHPESIDSTSPVESNRPFAGVSFDALTPLDPSIVKVWRLKTGIFLGILAVGILVWDILNAFQADRVLPFGVWSLIAATLAFVIAFWLPPLRYRYWGYELRDEELLLVRGIFNRVHTIIPLRRIQHLDVSQDIFEREFDVAKLIVHTAGTRSSDVILPGLHQDVAESLRDEMKQFITDQAL